MGRGIGRGSRPGFFPNKHFQHSRPNFPASDFVNGWHPSSSQTSTPNWKPRNINPLPRTGPSLRQEPAMNPSYRSESSPQHPNSPQKRRLAKNRVELTLMPPKECSEGYPDYQAARIAWAEKERVRLLREGHHVLYHKFFDGRVRFICDSTPVNGAFGARPVEDSIETRISGPRHAHHPSLSLGEPVPLSLPLIRLSPAIRPLVWAVNTMVA
ncbi:hypothetical protein CONPUDRAFT_81743 [Coniophora puteana RWD-64-598 SS2]|uniref:Uncharacterized protein n=1 Tax=Coniophora puteana (strain RWD-64-598) TaxID=741705 RepID=A0A5M3MT35_CONPW|nr:uncharacterized protein CONPUDRAFT_81743 [Coniophora puteana RWD-64-598 SS2]EIW82207.1 hypothetical protein CONPUDRAFT_81743 [Coniophora puteana RWD-64-598 SS2]